MRLSLIGKNMQPSIARIMIPASPDGSSDVPADVLIVEDDPIIAIDFEDRLLGFGVTSVRTVGSVAQALAAIAARAPDFALLDVELSRENSFAVAERLAALKIPLRLRHRLWRRDTDRFGFRQPAAFAKAVLERCARGRATVARLMTLRSG
ncbi:CheY-like chemotaxis protein [Bradyrhizobium japonicum]